MKSFSRTEVRVRPPQASWNATAATTPRQKAGTTRKEEPPVESGLAAMGSSSPPVLLLPPASGVVVVAGVGMLRPHHPYICHCLLGWNSASAGGRCTVRTPVFHRLQHRLQEEASPLWHLLLEPRRYVLPAPSIGPPGGNRHWAPPATTIQTGNAPRLSKVLVAASRRTDRKTESDEMMDGEIKAVTLETNRRKRSWATAN